uniref:Uncharacterized protein n=1 Tax=Sparus aurata TaxID=8175 RepID=A0A671WL86_SPAAU
MPCSYRSDWALFILYVCEDKERRHSTATLRCAHPEQLLKAVSLCFPHFSDHTLHIQLLHVDALSKSSSGSTVCPPVLMTLWMTFATWPLRRELSSLTRSSRQVQRTAREPAKRIRPTLRSDSSVETNKCLPADFVSFSPPYNTSEYDIS